MLGNLGKAYNFYWKPQSFDDGLIETFNEKMRKKAVDELLERKWGEGNVKLKRKHTKEITRPKVKLNAYKNVNRIINIIHQNRNLSKNQFLKSHFENIKSTKIMNEIKGNLLKKNELNF